MYRHPQSPRNHNCKRDRWHNHKFRQGHKCRLHQRQQYSFRHKCRRHLFGFHCNRSLQKESLSTHNQKFLLLRHKCRTHPLQRRSFRHPVRPDDCSCMHPDSYTRGLDTCKHRLRWLHLRRNSRQSNPYSHMDGIHHCQKVRYPRKKNAVPHPLNLRL